MVLCISQKSFFDISENFAYLVWIIYNTKHFRFIENNLVTSKKDFKNGIRIRKRHIC